ncbi:hypothetical protein OROMI_009048 [Orobanche minor]
MDDSLSSHLLWREFKMRMTTLLRWSLWLLVLSSPVCSNLGRQHSELYDESLVEEFYQEASIRVRSAKKGGDVDEISASICGVEIRINRHLWEDLFSLPVGSMPSNATQRMLSEGVVLS